MAKKINLDSLTDDQRAAVEKPTGAIRLVAGAGSGKTRVMADRIGYLLESGVKPHQILPISFTDDTAKQLTKRARLQNPDAPRAYTFHAFSKEILTRFKKKRRLLEPDTCDLMVKDILTKLNIANQYKSEKIRSVISNAKNAGLYTPDVFVYPPDVKTNEEDFIPEDVIKDTWYLYQRYMDMDKAADFDDLLILCRNLLFEDERARKSVHDQYKHVLVDEFQDTNMLQYEIVRAVVDGRPVLKENDPCTLPSWEGRSIIIVGDADQSIYRFRSAEVKLFVSFEKDYPPPHHGETIFLNQNFRSTQTIVNAANAVVANNKTRVDKVAFSKGEVGDPIRLIGCTDDNQMIERLINWAHQAVRGNKTAAILCRQNRLVDKVCKALREAGAPVVATGGIRFEDLFEVRNAAALLLAAEKPYHNERISMLARTVYGDSIGARLVGLAEKAVPSKILSLWEKLPYTNMPEALHLYRRIAEVSAAKQNNSLVEMLSIAVSRNWIKHLASEALKETKPEADDRLVALCEVFKRANLLESKGKGSDDLVSILTGDGDDVTGGVVEVITVHKSKGLEWENVAIVGCDEEVFPDSRSMETEEGVEEERRLFYVALTRPEKRCAIFYTHTYPSRFLAEIPREYVIDE